MKVWTIDEFVSECISLRENPYTYDYSNMPEGVCNGHNVKPSMLSWSSVVIDGGVVNLWKCINAYMVRAKTARAIKMSPLEYVRYLLACDLSKEV